MTSDDAKDDPMYGTTLVTQCDSEERLCWESRDINHLPWADLSFAPVNVAATSARARWKAGERPREGDSDLINYYYLALYPTTSEAKRRRKELGKAWRKDTVPRLVSRFGPIDGLDNYLKGSKSTPT